MAGAGHELSHSTAPPSGDPTPSEADIKTTREPIRAGRLLKIEAIDHVVMGTGSSGFKHLRELGYFL